MREQLQRQPRLLQQHLWPCCDERTVPLNERRLLLFALVTLPATMASSCSSGAAGTAPTATVVGLSAQQQPPARRITRDGGWEREEVLTDDGLVAVITERTEHETRSSFYDDSGRLERLLRREVISQHPLRVRMEVTTFSRDSRPDYRETWVEDEASNSIEVSVEFDPTHTGKWLPGKRYVRPRGEK